LAVDLGRTPQVIGDDNCDRPLVRIAWCSGGAQSLFEQAVEQGVDVYLSGEVSEQNVHLARESGVIYIAAGHHATERYGVRALAEHLAERFDCNVNSSISTARCDLAGRGQSRWTSEQPFPPRPY